MASTIRVENFGGMIPRVSDRLLPQEFATTATNTKLFSGELRGWNNSTLTQQLSLGYTATRIYKLLYNGNDLWDSSQYEETSWVEAPLINDSYERVYWSLGPNGAPRYNTKARINSGSSSYLLGIPAPTVTPTLGTTGGSAAVVTRAYVFTYVSDYGEESAPSDPITASGPSDATWNFNNLGTNIATDMSDSTSRAMSTSSTKKIYRTITGTSGQTTFFFVDEINVNTGTFADTSSDEDIAFNSLLETSGWDIPPTTLDGLIVHPNGFLVGFSGSDIYMTEPYRPHTWPTKYILSTDSAIVGLGVVGNTIAIITESNPYTLTGTHPSSVVFRKTNSIEPGISRYSIVSLKDCVVYASQNGLVKITSNNIELVTRESLTKDEWVNEFSPSTIQAFIYNDAYIAMFSTYEGFLFNPQEPRASLTYINVTDPVDYIYTDKHEGNTYLLVSNNIYRFDPPEDSIPVVYEWKSKVFEFTKPINLGAGMVKLDTTGFTVSQAYLDSLTEVNTTISTEYDSEGNIHTLNSRPLNGVRPRSSYSTDLQTAGYLQRRSVGSNDFIDLDAVSNLVANAQLTVWANGNIVFSEPVTNNTLFRLPAGYKVHTYQFSISSNTNIYSVALAENARGLREV